ncbi:hypothetical protein AVEN_120809-1 [Araneus ventricosus]|uniref:Uncharacterized protein n=1 Tax=Araneus ventricosus TaxID=182803 RepID=A0A4Y2FD90_ARAVE|nr:hypothetical protein AVEN_120809-1 [Araneus ventricosus]
MVIIVGITQENPKSGSQKYVFAVGNLPKCRQDNHLARCHTPCCIFPFTKAAHVPNFSLKIGLARKQAWNKFCEWRRSVYSTLCINGKRRLSERTGYLAPQQKPMQCE